MHGGGGGAVHGRGACVAGGSCMVEWHAWHTPPDTTRYGDTVNERSVCILLQCILVWQIFSTLGTENPDITRNLVKESPVVLHLLNNSTVYYQPDRFWNI